MVRKQTRLSPEYVLLGFLYQHSSHGYELHRRLLDEFGYIWHVSQSQTYNILKRLESLGYITSSSVEQEKLPPRRLLQLTDLGSQRFNTWLDKPTKCSVHTIRVEFITRLFFLQHYQPQKIQESIYLQTIEVHTGLKRLEEVRLNLPDDQTFNHLALDLRINLLNSIINWLDMCRDTFAHNHLQRDVHD